MSRKKRSSGIGYLLVIIITAVLASVVILAFMVFTGTGVNSNPVTQAVNREVTKKAVEAAIQKETGSDITLEEIRSEMSEEDAEEFDDIVNKYADEGILAEALSALNSNDGDLAATAATFKDKVSTEDYSRLFELYEKYGDEILKKQGS
ncbi:MAG: hypothetical protein IJT63_04195 [Lachnospiraceae bacterium]|nr:hypothetical protein [Lachnospiraceae bacterium]